MTRGVHRSAVKDVSCSANGHLNHERGDTAAMGDHLRSHVHLTNCIHLKNHIHQQSPNMAERFLMRDLILLQRSRSLRDPSASPPSWVSPSMVGSFARRAVHDCALQNGRKSFGVDQRIEIGRLSASSPAVRTATMSKVAAAKAGNDYGKDAEVMKEEEPEVAGKKRNEPVASGSRKSFKDPPDSVQGKEKKKYRKNARERIVPLKMLSEQLEEVTNQISNDGKKLSPVCQPERPVNEIFQVSKESIYNSRNGRNPATNRKFKGFRRHRGSADLRSNRAHTSMTSGSHLIAKGINANIQDCKLDIPGSPKNVCGIPWNWSRIHHRGKTFLDKAGRSLSCGLSDSRLRKSETPVPQRDGNASTEVVGYDDLTHATSDSEVLPLLPEASGSHESAANHLLARGYSGELGIFSNHSLQESDSDHASQSRLGNHRKFGECKRDRHRSLTQKYMPKTFKDIVGQSFVVQALSNAVSKNKVGLIYVFYGPHGTGKTSCAHVFAKALNCQSPEQPRPCNDCNSCILHNLGRSKDVTELGPLANFDFERIMDVFGNMMLSPRPSQYKILIIDDCDTLPTNSWGAISKVIDGIPRHVVFILVSSSLDHFPHIIISRCQKFFFPKLKDSDIISALHWISANEGLEIDKDALKLIASRSDGSLRDAEMTLDQLSLLGQRVSLSLVQELVGLVADEKLVDLLDLALSADTVNTVKILREIMETGVDPLALMSQLATVITDILAGSYVFTQERLRRRFFHQLTLSKADMEKLRQALKRLSEAEKQLRVSNDRLTWLTAVLLQLAPDQQYMMPNSSTDRSFSHSPIILNNNNTRGAPRSPAGEQDEVVTGNRGLSRGIRKWDHNSYVKDMPKGVMVATNQHGAKGSSDHILHNLVLSETNNCSKSHEDIKEIWQAVLDNIQSDIIRQFLYREGRIHSVNLDAAPTVHLLFSSNVNKSRVEKFRVQILRAFEATLGSAVIVEISCESRNNVISDVQNSPSFLTFENSSVAKSRQYTNNQTSVCSGPQYLRRSTPRENVVEGTDFNNPRWSRTRSHVTAEDEIIEIGALSQECRNTEPSKMNTSKERGLDSAWIEEASSSQQQNLISSVERKDTEERHQSKSLVRGKIPLSHVIQHAEGSSEQGWSRRKAISIAEKLEQDNLKLEPGYRSLICWKTSRRARAKPSKLRNRSKKPCALMKLVSCGRCLSLKSP